jgi:hypothetical protein
MDIHLRVGANGNSCQIKLPDLVALRV